MGCVRDNLTDTPLDSLPDKSEDSLPDKSLDILRDSLRHGREDKPLHW